MLFSSKVFLFAFLPIVLFLYYAVGKTVKEKYRTVYRNVLLFISSLVFYAADNLYFLSVMLLSITANWLFGMAVDKYKDTKKAKTMLVLSLVFNLGMIFVFKYLSFTVANINSLFNTSLAVPKISLPLGISFFTFQSISYVADVYRKKVDAQRSFYHVGLYISLFPQLIAGPIVRYKTVADEIDNRKIDLSLFSDGVCRFIIGLCKKVLIANTTALIADAAFAQSDLSMPFAWLGAVSYTLQIYFDFSGYSDMAIGLGRMFGFHFEENFNFPYIARSVTDFWRRWHISLSSWFRDYVYIPLGGNRCSKAREIFNLFIVWLLTGIWHGAAWNFIIWGLFYFVIILFERTFLKKYIDKNAKPKLPHRMIGHILTLICVISAWVLFRAESLSAAMSYLGSMFAGKAEFDIMFLRYFSENKLFLICGILFSMPISKIPRPNENGKDSKIVNAAFGILYPVLLSAGFILACAYIVKGSYNPFIYFNF